MTKTLKELRAEIEGLDSAIKIVQARREELWKQYSAAAVNHRYDREPKSEPMQTTCERTNLILSLRAQNKSFRAIGAKLGVTGQRAQQIYADTIRSQEKAQARVAERASQ